MWIQHFENRFKRDYKNLSLGIQEKVKDAIEILVNSDNPRKFGLHKTARYNCIHAYEIGRQYRILYNVYDKDNIIEFLKVGLHNQVY
jgi:addiction module RelE/StbE family toxin